MIKVRHPRLKGSKGRGARPTSERSPGGPHATKTAVIGAIKRGRNGDPSQAIVRVIPNTRRKTVMPFVNDHVSREDSVLYTDSLKSYEQPLISRGLVSLSPKGTSIR